MPAPTSVNVRTLSAQRTAKSIARSLFGRALGFRDCRLETLDALVEAGQLHTLGKGEVFAHRGAPFDMLAMIVEGSLEASLLRQDGHRHLVNFLQPGDVFGMISMLDGLGHVNDIRARTGGTTVLKIPGDVIRALREHDRSLGLAFERQLASRSRLLSERMASDPAMPLEMRLARLLQTLVGLYGIERPEGLLLEMKISQADLGDWLGVSRQRANFAVQKLRADGLITLRYSNITIIDPQRLADKARL